MRVIVDATLRLRDPHHLEQLDRALCRCPAVHLQVQFEGFRELAADGQHRVEGSHRLLEDHAYLVAAYVADLLHARRPDASVRSMVGKRGLEPLRLSARDPKSRSSTSSDTSPPGGPPRTRTWNLAIKSRLLCQIELVAHGLAAHLVRFAKYITAQIGEAT